jgi:hypothetical protein
MEEGDGRVSQNHSMKEGDLIGALLAFGGGRIKRMNMVSRDWKGQKHSFSLRASRRPAVSAPGS